jgi:flagellar protein FlaG
MLIEPVIPAFNLGKETFNTSTLRTPAVASPNVAQPPAHVAQNESASKTEPNMNAQELKAALQQHNLALNFSRDAKSGAIIVRLIDQQTGEIVRQVPSDVSLKLAEAFAAFQRHFVNRSA